MRSRGVKGFTAVLTAIAVPSIPPAKLLVPNKPKMVILCLLLNHPVSDLTAFGQAVDYDEHLFKIELLQITS